MTGQRFAVTGAGGFLGWHTRVRCLADGNGPVATIAVGDLFDAAVASKTISDTDVLIHIAGINRGSDNQITTGNVWFAKQVAEALRHTTKPPTRLIFANSVQSGNGSPYGTAKARAASILADAAASCGVEFADVHLPNLFGEHGQPFYNSVVATFCHQLAVGDTPTVDGDRCLTLMHVQSAITALLSGTTPDHLSPEVVEISVAEIKRILTKQASSYSLGNFPDLTSDFSLDLFNTYRSFGFEAKPAMPLLPRNDERGRLVETVRAEGGGGQAFVSSTNPGLTRGQHFHLRKVERFVVIRGRANIVLRRLLTNNLVTVVVSGDDPVAVDMPTMWAHKITNIGDVDLVTQFWSNEIFDPKAPDTFAEEV